MKNQQKWSGVKLSKKELEEVRKEEKLEIIGSVIGFIVALGFLFFIGCLITLTLGRL